MLKIYHNPKCSKSREGLCFLETINQPFEVIKYLDNPINKEELKQLIKLLGCNPIDVVRTKETIWKENFASKELTQDQILDILIEYPKLIERPIIVNENKAIIARPTELIKNIL